MRWQRHCVATLLSSAIPRVSRIPTMAADATAAEIRAAMLSAGGAPVAKIMPFSQTVEVAGATHTLDDEYQWMRGKAWPKLVQDEDIIAHLEAENAYCKDFLASLGDLQETFFQTMKGRMKLTDRTVEVRQGLYYYYSRTEETQQYSIDCRAPVTLFDELKGLNGAELDDALRQAEEVILDRNKLAEGKAFCKALGTTVSLNGKAMAYRVDTQGDENYCLKFVNLETGEYLPDELWNVASYCFHQPSDADETGAAPLGIFYSLRNKNLRPTKIFYHRFGDVCEGSQDFAPNDRLLLQSKNEMFGLSVGATADRQFVTLRHASKTENEVFVIDVNDAEMRLVNLLPMVDEVEYSVAKSGASWFLRTKAGCVKDHFRLERGEWVDEGTKREVRWRPYIAEKSKYAFEGMGVTADYLLLSYLDVTTGVPLLVVRRAAHPEADLGTEELFPAQPADATYCKLVAFPGIAEPEALSHTASFSGATDYAFNRIVVVLDTPALPTTWFDWDWSAEGPMTVRKQKEVPNYNPEEYHTERFYARYTEDKGLALHETLHESTDAKYADSAVSVPVTVLYKKSLFRKDGSMPLLLEGYGSYGISEEPVWRNTHTLYADLGFVVATAHIRGGGDLGEPWYQAAKFLSKKRTFLDFIAAADKLAEDKYTSPGNVAIVGGSAGGMLVGACLNLRPSLFKAIVAHVPFVTVLDTMLDGDLPLTPGEFKEWGNPRDEHYFEYMRSYCPYENCRFVKDFLAKPGNVFPSIFATSGLSDYRVGYYEAAKWVARIRAGIAEAKAQAPEGVFNEPLLVFETNMAAGHAGASGRFDRLKEVSRDVAFLATEFDVQGIRAKL